MNKKTFRLLMLLMASCLFSFALSYESKASAGTVTSYEKVTWGISTGRYGVNGIQAFCAEYSKSWPTVGTTIDSIIESQNEILRKALYYGSNGPGNVLGNDARAHVLTAIAISDANIGEANTGASAKYDEFYWDLVNNPDKYPAPPKNFHAYLAITSSSELQNLAFYRMEANGYVKAVKQSANNSLTEGNSYYSLEGAVYGLYSSSGVLESARVGTLTMDVNGNSNTVELAPGTYYACELVAPKGYKKSTEIISFNIKSKETILLHFKDIPQTKQIELLIQKVDAETKENVPQGKASLAGAKFQVQYFAGMKEEGSAPVRNWVFETDESGKILYREEYKVSGDDLFEELPFGTITIQEISASEGYLVNDTIFVREIKSDADYDVPIVEEDPIQVVLIKYQTNTEITLPGVVFQYLRPDGTTEEVMTDENGRIVIKGVSYGTHTLKEVATIDGYILNEQSIEFEVNENTNEHINLVAYNDYLVLPKTGTSARFLMTLSGTVFCVSGIIINKKYKQKRRNSI